MNTDLEELTDRAMRVRALYEQLEKHHHGTAWTPPELMVGFLYDIGELGRLVMAADGRWLHEGDTPRALSEKFSECLWWMLVLSKRLDVDLAQAFIGKMEELETSLQASVARVDASAEG